MRSIYKVFVFWVMSLAPVWAQDPPHLVQIMADVRADEWASAFQGAENARVVSDEYAALHRDIVYWRYLRAGEGSPEEYISFITRNPDWPDLYKVYLRGEPAFGEAPLDEVLEFLDGRTPLTGTGALALARAYAAQGRGDEATQTIRTAWQTVSMTLEEMEEFQLSHSAILHDLHETRLDMLLWDGHFEQALAMLPLVGDEWKALAEARIALRLRHNGVDALIEAVPADLQDHPGLAYERFVWRDRAGNEAGAADVAIAQTDLGDPADWSDRRRSAARQLMRDRDYQRAYDLASMHGLSAGDDYADLEWLSGYISLRFLNKPEQALTHFNTFRAAVWTPISVGRAGYWLGRTHEVLGNEAEARIAYAEAAQHQTSFYGQLAAEHLGLAMDPSLTATETFPDWRNAEFRQSTVIQASLIFLEGGERNLAEWFVIHYSEGRSREEYGQLIDMYLALGEPHIPVRLAKQAIQEGHAPIMHGYFPLHALMDEDLTVPAELALSIARRESEFDPNAKSPVGARGLMQIMPDTAAHVADGLGIEYSGPDQLEDWDYNVLLGDAYLAELIEEFGHSYALVSAGYNAGPSRPTRWVEVYGDPRRSAVDAVDWVEHIPFRETRNYVMRVMESLPVYRARISGAPVELRLSEELRCSC